MSCPASRSSRAPLLDRRAFCAGLAGLACAPGCRRAPSTVGGIPGMDLPQQLTVTTHGEGTAKVVEARWAAAVDSRGRPDPQAVATLLRAALERLTGVDDPWRALLGADPRAAIKVNTIKSQAFTHPELATAIARAIVARGARADRVTVWDRDTSGLEDRGYALDPTGQQGFRCLGGDQAPEGTRATGLVAGVKVHLSPLLTDAEALISVAALKDHSMAGVSLSLKNNFGVIPSLEAQQLHGDVHRGSGCEPGISELAALPAIRQRLKLAIIDGLVGVCNGGPGTAAPGHVFRRGSLLVSRDPAALDQQGLAIIEARRKELGLLPLAKRTTPNPSPAIHVDNAARRGVGPA